MSKKMPGKAVKLSQAVVTYLRKKGEETESYDSILRREFGLPSRKGEDQSLCVYYLVPGGKPELSESLAEARGAAILLAARKGLKKAVSIITLREIP